MGDADLTYDFDEIPRFVEELDDGADLVMGNRMDNIQPGRDAVAAPLRRQPDPVRLPQRPLPAPACATPTAACARSAATSSRASTCARRAWSSPREMVIRAAKEQLDIRQFPIEYHPRGGESKLSTFARRLAPPALPARPQPDPPLPDPRRCDDGARRADRRLIGRRADRRLRPRVGHPRDDRRLAADDRRHAGRRARPLRARLRHVLHGRAATRGSTACARASGSSTGCCWAARSLLVGLVVAGVIVVQLDRPRLRRSSARSAWRSSPRR